MCSRLGAWVSVRGAVAAVGPNATGVQADAADLGDLDRLFAQIAIDGRRLDVLVANAGGGEFATLELTTEEHFDQTRHHQHEKHPVHRAEGTSAAQ